MLSSYIPTRRCILLPSLPALNSYTCRPRAAPSLAFPLTTSSPLLMDAHTQLAAIRQYFVSTFIIITAAQSVLGGH